MGSVQFGLNSVAQAIEREARFLGQRHGLSELDVEALGDLCATRVAHATRGSFSFFCFLFRGGGVRRGGGGAGSTGPFGPNLNLAKDSGRAKPGQILVKWGAPELNSPQHHWTATGFVWGGSRHQAQAEECRALGTISAFDTR